MGLQFFKISIATFVLQGYAFYALDSSSVVSLAKKFYGMPFICNAYRCLNWPGKFGCKKVSNFGVKSVFLNALTSLLWDCLNIVHTRGDLKPAALPAGGAQPVIKAKSFTKLWISFTRYR